MYVCLLRYAGTFSAGVCCLLATPQLVHSQDASVWSADRARVEALSSKQSDYNYRESRISEYSLPETLRMQDGTQVSSADAWPARRAELMELFRDQVYGRRPEIKYSTKYDVIEEDRGALGGTAVGRTVKATIGIDKRTFEFRFVVLIPKGAEGPVPAVVHINNRTYVPLAKAGENDAFWPAKTLVSRGYAAASFHTSDVDPDRADGYADGIRGFFANGAAPEDDSWRSLSAWAWAASRIADYLETCPEIAMDKLAVVGHSRAGKTALWAGCEDTRFQIVYSNNSGCGGAALSRRAFGETVARITDSFPHWFCKNFSAYAGDESKLPVDQHQVMAMIAPRSIYVTSADEDLWADPRGEFLSLAASAPVFDLLGEGSLHGTKMPKLNTPKVVGSTGYHIRTGGHGLGVKDWGWFLDFSDATFRKSK